MNTIIRYRKVIKEILFFLFQKIKFVIYWALFRNGKIANINSFELRVYSQNGEDGIIKIIFHKIGTTNKYFVELGTENGKECNSALLLEKGWTGLQIDSKKTRNKFVKREFVTAENVEKVLKKYDVPKNFDLLSIDIDGNDYWVWKELKIFYPRVVVIEYNASIPPNESKVVPYNPRFKWDGTNYFGASLLALTKLSQKKGYQLIGCDSTGTNAFFVKRELTKKNFKVRPLMQVFKTPKYGVKIFGLQVGHRPPTRIRPFMTV